MAIHPYTIRKQPAQVRTELASRFKAVRKAAKLTQVALAQKSGVTLAPLRRFETTGRVSLENVSLLVYGLGRLGELEKLFAEAEELTVVADLFSRKRDAR